MANTITVGGLAITPARRQLLADVAAYLVADDEEGTAQLTLGQETFRVAEAMWLMRDAGLVEQPDDILGWRLTEMGTDVLEGRVTS